MAFAQKSLKRWPHGPHDGPRCHRRSLCHPNVLRIESAFLHHCSLVLAVEFCDLGDLQVVCWVVESGSAEFIGAVFSD